MDPQQSFHITDDDTVELNGCKYTAFDGKFKNIVFKLILKY